MPEKKKISIKTQMSAVLQNKPYLIAVAGQFLFGLTLYGRNADALYYFTYVEGNQALFSTYSLFIIIPSVVGAACFPPLFKLTNNKGKAASIFALLTGVCMLCMCFFSAEKSPVFFMPVPVCRSFSFPDSIRRFMLSFRTAWNTASGKQGCATTDFNMRLFPSAIRSEWLLELPYWLRRWAPADMRPIKDRMTPCLP